jgi:glutamyl-tRNA reductase
LSRLFVIGLSHRTAPIEIREAMVDAHLTLPAGEAQNPVSSRDGEVMRKRLQSAAALCGEAMLLSTCNRVELYGALPAAGETQAVLTRIEELFIQPLPQARKHIYRLEGEPALSHLYRVASSLDSMVVGEPQILGQVKAAYREARSAGTVGQVLGSVLPRAFAIAKRVRSETAIGESPASVASVAVDLARQIFGELAGHPVMLVGAGKMAELCARHLHEAGATDFIVVNRTVSRAEELAARLGGSAHALTELEPLLSRAAVVLFSAGAPEPLLRAEVLARAMKARRGRWLLLIDIAVPRDVDPQCGKLDNVYLYDIDALSEVVAGNLGERRKAAQAAEAILQVEMQRTAERDRSADVVPLIRALRERAQGIADAEVARVLPRLGPLGDRERALVTGLADAVVNKLLHGPLTALKRGASESSGGGELAEAVRRLWSLPAQAPAEDIDEESEGS